MRSQTKLRPLAAAVSALFAAPFDAWADDKEKKIAESTAPQVEVTAAPIIDDFRAVTTDDFRLPGAVRDIPQSVTIIPDALMRSEGATTLRDVLRNQPGMVFSAGEGGQYGDNFTMRGFSGRNDIFLDSTRDLGQYRRDVFNLDAVEVLKGPSSMIFGRGSTGAVVNQISKRPMMQDYNMVSGSVGTDDYWRGTADLNKPLSESAAFRLNLMGEYSESSRESVWDRRWGVAPAVQLRLNPDASLYIGYLGLFQDYTPDYGLPYLQAAGGQLGKPVPVDYSSFYGTAADRTSEDANIVTAWLDYRLGPNVTLRNATRFSNIETDISATAPRFVGTVTVNSNLNNVSLNRQSQERTVTNEVFYNQTDLRINFNTGSLKHEVLLGAEFGVEKEHIVRYTRSRPMITPTTPDTIFAPNPYLAESQVGLRVASTADNGNVDTELNSLALLAQDFLSITDQWKVLGGLRWDDVDSEYTSTTGTAPHFERNDQAWSVRAGLVFQPTATQMYYGYYGTSFNPSAEFLTLSAATQQLDPEENETFELGARWDVLSSRLTLQGAIFRTDKTNARTVDPTNATVMVLDGKQRVDGVELGAVGRITPAWQVFAGLVYQDGQIVEGFEAVGGVPVSRAGNTLQSTPPWSGSLWTTYTWPRGWQLGGGLFFTSDAYANNANTIKVEGYTRFDVMAAYVQPKWSVQLNVYNVTDEQYIDNYYSGHAVPGRDRWGALTFTYRF